DVGGDDRQPEHVVAHREYAEVDHKVNQTDEREAHGLERDGTLPPCLLQASVEVSERLANPRHPPRVARLAGAARAPHAFLRSLTPPRPTAKGRTTPGATGSALCAIPAGSRGRPKRRSHNGSQCDELGGWNWRTGAVARTGGSRPLHRSPALQRGREPARA